MDLPDGPGGHPQTSGECRRCATSLRTPEWGREYACPVCGELLGGVVRIAQRRLPAWLFYVAGAAVLCGAIVKVAGDRLASRMPPTSQLTRQAIQPPPVVGPAIHPEDYEDEMRAKLAFLEKDLAVEPGSAVYLHQAAEVALNLGAMLSQTQREDEGRRLAERSRAYAVRLRPHRPLTAKDLMSRLTQLRSLNWVLPNADGKGVQVGLGAAQPMQLFRGGPVGATPLAQPQGLVAPLAGGVLPAPIPAPGAGGNAPVAILPVPEPPAPRTTDELRRLFRAHSEDPALIDELGQRLEQMSGAGSFARADQEGLLREALQVYSRGAGHVRLRLHRAAFLQAAAAIHGRLTEYDRQAALLRQATRAYPYGSLIWSELAAACLRLGKEDQYQEALRQARRWRLPRAVQ